MDRKRSEKVFGREKVVFPSKDENLFLHLLSRHEKLLGNKAVLKYFLMAKFKGFFSNYNPHIFFRALHFLQANLPLSKGVKFLSLILFFVLNIFSQTEPTIEENIFQSSKNLHQWGTISSFNGLPSEKINAIAQTPDGFLWFASDNGLAKFDGRRVQTNISSGLSSLRILSLEADKDGTLWIGTEKGAFFYQDGFFQVVQETKEYAINSIFIDGDEIFFTGSIIINRKKQVEKGAVFRSIKDKATVKTEKLLDSSLKVRSGVKIKEDFFIGTYNTGLLKVDKGAAEQFITKPRRPYFINVMKKHRSADVWFGTNAGLFKTDKFPNLKGVGDKLGKINSINFGENNEVWIGTDEGGAYFFNGKDFQNRFTFENTSGGLRSNKILATFVDREGVVWFGTDKGVSRYDPKSPRNERLSNDRESNFVRTLYTSKEGIHYAGTNRGLFEFSEKSKMWRLVKGFEMRSVYSVYENNLFSLLVGSSTSLTAKFNQRIGPIVANESIRAITNFQDETYFASFEAGLKKLDSDETKIDLDTTAISLYNESDKNLWIGTVNQGVFKYDGKQVIAIEKNDELKSNAIHAISGNASDGIWFATSKGLYLLKDEKLQVILSDQEVRDVFTKRDADDKSLQVWCATENGLFKFIFEEHFGWVSTRIDVEEGLSSQNIFAVSSIGDSSILIGTNRGIVRYETTNVKPILFANRIVSQRVHQASELQNGISLGYPQNTLSVDVLAISSRTYPEQFDYSFLLFDSNNKLIDSKFSEDSQFLMDKLETDKYRVEVRAYDKNLLSSQPLIFYVTVGKAPFPLIATVLGVLLMIAIAALIWAIWSQQKIFQTSEKLVFANKELNNARLNLANEGERERHRISRDLHDQTLADLRHLLLMADEVQTEKATEFRSEIESVSNEIRRICEDLSPSVLENIGFAAALEWAIGNSVEQVSKEQKIEHEFYTSDSLEDNLKLTSAEQIQVYRITQEILSNIVRHSEATKIIMRAETSDELGFTLRIIDNGKTFNPDESKKGRGLANIAARAKLIKAKFDWEMGEESGMVFLLAKKTLE